MTFQNLILHVIMALKSNLIFWFLSYFLFCQCILCMVEQCWKIFIQKDIYLKDKMIQFIWLHKMILIKDEIFCLEHMYAWERELGEREWERERDRDRETDRHTEIDKGVNYWLVVNFIKSDNVSRIKSPGKPN